MRINMSIRSRRELLGQVAPRYRESSRKEKSNILKEFVASTGYNQKYAIRLMGAREIPQPRESSRPREPRYGEAVREALETTWAAANYIGSKRLGPFLPDLVPVLEAHGHLEITSDVRSALISVSPATIDRLLKPIRAAGAPRGISTTKAGALLKRQIPVRTFADWDEQVIGFFEADLVAHCGTSVEGSPLFTLVLTDIASTWVECFPLLTRTGEAVIQALEHMRGLIPFEILGFDTDNGSEFINAKVLEYCRKEKITFTRGRAHKKNDQCFVEQKNGVVVRQFVGYDRFEGMAAYRQLGELYRALRLYVNFFQPSMKLKRKTREGSKVRRYYDTASTPFQRLRATGQADAARVEKLEAVYKALDPVRLLSQIKVLQDALWRHAVVVPVPDVPSANPDPKREGDNRFDVPGCSSFGNQEENEDANDWLARPEERHPRKYRRTKKPRAPRTWRTRKDPFESVREEICLRLEANPEKTAKSLLQELIDRYPTQYNANQLRTLQRRVKEWRARTILTFQDDWVHDEQLLAGTLPGTLGVMKDVPDTRQVQPASLS